MAQQQSSSSSSCCSHDKSTSLNKPFCCVECGRAVPHLHTSYGANKANIRLTRCQCGHFADKYQEYDGIILVIDLILQKRPAYRHVLLNYFEYNSVETPLASESSSVCEKGGSVQSRAHSFRWIPLGCNIHILKFGIMLILFEVYVKCFNLESGSMQSNSSTTFFGSPYFDYLAVLLFSLCEAISYHVIIRGAIYSNQIFRQARVLTLEEANKLSMGILFSSFGNFITILMVIWNIKEPEYGWLIQWLVFLSHSESLAVLLKVDSTAYTMIYVVSGFGFKWGVRFLLAHLLPGRFAPLWLV